MDRGAWWATVVRVTKSQTRLKCLSKTQHYKYFSYNPRQHISASLGIDKAQSVPSSLAAQLLRRGDHGLAWRILLLISSSPQFFFLVESDKLSRDPGKLTSLISTIPFVNSTCRTHGRSNISALTLPVVVNVIGIVRIWIFQVRKAPATKIF